MFSRECWQSAHARTSRLYGIAIQATGRHMIHELHELRQKYKTYSWNVRTILHRFLKGPLIVLGSVHTTSFHGGAVGRFLSPSVHTVLYSLCRLPTNPCHAEFDPPRATPVAKPSLWSFALGSIVGEINVGKRQFCTHIRQNSILALARST